MTGQTRRTVLGTLAGLGAAGAGCLGLGGPSGTPTTADSGGFERVGVEGTTLAIDVADGSAVERVNVIAPDGTVAWQRSVAAGATRVEFDVGLSYQPGTHRIVGLGDGETVAETTIDLTPDIAITSVGVGANHLDEMPDNLSYKDRQAVVTLTNHGFGPEGLAQLLLLGDLPNPTEDLQDSDNHNSGVFDTSDGYGDDEQPLIPAKSEVTFYTTSMPFLFTGDGIQCKSEVQEGTFEVRVRPTLSEATVTTSYGIRYSSSESRDGCTITVSEGGE